MEGLEAVLAALSAALAAFFADSNETTADALRQQLLSFINLLQTFPANPQTQTLETLLLNIINQLDGPDYNSSLISQLVSQFFNGLASFFGTLEIDPLVLQGLLQSLID
ncbi:TPA: collagen-like repeat preface domain-containing protein, partial [Bacillus cereus]